MTCLNDYEMIIRMNVERRRNDNKPNGQQKCHDMKGSW